MTRDAILTCSQKLAWVSLIYCTELTTKKWRNRITTHTHAHTHLTALFPGLSGWASTRKVKPIWISLKQEMVSGSSISWAASLHLAPDRYHTSSSPLSFLQAGCPSCRPTNSVKALRSKNRICSEVSVNTKCALLLITGESVESVPKKKRKATVGRICRKGRF